MTDTIINDEESRIIERELIGTLIWYIETHGRDNQMVVAIEEMAELSKELCKIARGNNNPNCVKEEMIDVYVMMRQLMIIFNVTETELIGRAHEKLVMGRR